MVIVDAFQKIYFYIFVSILLEQRVIIGRMTPLPHFGEDVHIINVFLLSLLGFHTSIVQKCN